MILEYGTKIDEIKISELLAEDGKPRTMPDAQRELDLPKWRRRVGPWNPSFVGVVRVKFIKGKGYVTDGQHRIAEAALLGYTIIRAEVSVGNGSQDAASAFLGANTSRQMTRRTISDVKLVAGDPTWTEIMKTLDAYGFERKPARGSHGVLPTGHYKILHGDAALEKLHNKGVLDQALFIYGRLGENWPASAAQPSAFLGHLGNFLFAHPEMEYKRLLQRLGTTTLVKIEQAFGKAKLEAPRAEGSTVYAWVLVDLYNKGLHEDAPRFLIKKANYRNS